MKNEIKEYKEYIKMQAADPDVDKKALAQQLLVRIGFYQAYPSHSNNELCDILPAVADTGVDKCLFSCIVGASACTSCSIHSTLLFS